MISRLLEKAAHFAESFAGTAVREFIWSTRHLFKGKDWTRGYWESVNHPHRQLLIAAISSYAPIESALEIGCNSGPNCYLLAKKYPGAKFFGIDINRRAVRDGNRWIAENRVKNVVLLENKADAVAGVADKSLDIVFTDATLIYIGPDKIKKILGHMLRVARKAVILNEWHLDGKKNCFNHEGHWVYDYRNLLKGHEVKITRIPPRTWSAEWERFGAIIEVIP